MTIRLFSAAVLAAIALGCYGQPVSAQQPSGSEEALLAAEQDRDDRPEPRREARPRDRAPGDDRRPDGDRAPDARRPEDRAPQPRGPESEGRGGNFGGGGFGARGGRSGFDGGFGPGGRQHGPPGGPMTAPPHAGGGPGGLDERIARLEHKLDAVLHELHALRAEHAHFGPMGSPHHQWSEQHFDAHRMPGPPNWARGPQPRRFSPAEGPPSHPRAGGPPRDWDSPTSPRGDRSRDRDRDRDDEDDDDRPRRED